MAAAQKTISVGLKPLIATAASLATLAALALAVHSEIVLPSILMEARKETEAQIKAHAEYPHPVSVSRREFQMVLSRIDKFEANVSRRLDRVDQKLGGN